MNVAVGRIGSLVTVTWRAREALDSVGYSADELVARHAAHDWGNASEQNRKLNELGLSTQGPIISPYELPGDCVVWVVTSAGHAETVVLTPSEVSSYGRLFGKT